MRTNNLFIFMQFYGFNNVVPGNIGNICPRLQVGIQGGMVGFSSINMVQWNPSL
jgi:hypothetical protein